jgi:cytoskeleton protein RodZ
MSEPADETLAAGETPPVAGASVEPVPGHAPAVQAVAAGNPLAVARAAAGLSIADVGRQLKLSGWQVEALESGDYKRLPGPVFVRGFIRNYARLLKIDPAPLLAEIAAPVPVATVPAAVAEPTRSKAIPFPGQHGFPWKPYALGALVVIAGLAAYQLFGDELFGTEVDTGSVELPQPKVVGETKPVDLPAPLIVDVAPPKTVVTPSPAVPAAVTTAPAMATPAAPVRPSDKAAPVAVKPPEPAPIMAVTKAAPTIVPAPVPKPAIAAPVAVKPPEPAPITPMTKPVPTVELRPANTPKPAVEAAAPNVKPAESRAAAADERIVRMVFSRESWVEIRDRQGRTIFSQLNPAGSAQSISGQPPFRLVVGNASGVRVLFNDRSVDLAPYTQVDVARLTLE